ncbi:venom peptide SjAPI-like [Diabrotica virgifera virgifera]|uniref:Uncharacterized protein n=1 Tax=Diabrotica virgifera virgifera TaxID=50390 RepID=A0ABM5KU69_DIAVI|nr:venom peptide SjAPI-like [Diabrotica virgifera virgifera]
MKLFYLFVILSFLATLVFGQTELNCGKNSHQGCVPCCPSPTCRYRNPECPDDKVCTDQCTFTCLCDKGYIYDDIGFVGGCIRPKDCPRIG